jgi:S1-C subfamily serine protease
LPAARGAIVSSVQAGGPAETAGIKRGDVIVAFNDQVVVDSNSLRNQVASTSPGSDVTLTLLRDGRETKVQMKLAELPARAPEGGEEGTGPGAQGSGRFGLTVEPLTPEMASRLGLGANDQGLVVTRVDASGSAAEAGIRQGDVIQEVNRQPVRTMADFNSAIQRSGARPALVLLNRRGNVIYLTLRPRP